MANKAFEVVAECAMAGFPTNADITRVTEKIERVRRDETAIARATVQTPAVYRDRAYALTARFLVWATDGPQAMDKVGNLLQGAGVHCRAMHLSGRALADADLRRPAASPPAAPKAARRASPKKPARRKAPVRKAPVRKAPVRKAPVRKVRRKAKPSPKRARRRARSGPARRRR